MISAVARGVPVRLITDPDEYRNPTRLWACQAGRSHVYGGRQIKMRSHEGLTHEALVVMHGLGEVIFGSSNWTPPASAGSSDEHNYFYDPSLGKPWFFQWFADQFEHKWNDAANFVPVPAAAAGNAVVLVAGQPCVRPVRPASTLDWDGGAVGTPLRHLLRHQSESAAAREQPGLGSPRSGPTRDVYRHESAAWHHLLLARRRKDLGADRRASGPTWSFATSGHAARTHAIRRDAGGRSRHHRGGELRRGWTVHRLLRHDGGKQGRRVSLDGCRYRARRAMSAAVSTSGKTRAGEWLTYTVNVAATGNYSSKHAWRTSAPGATFHVEVDGVDRTGPIAVPDTGGWQTWQTITTTGIPLTAGQRVLRVVLDQHRLRAAGSATTTGSALRDHTADARTCRTAGRRRPSPAPSRRRTSTRADSGIGLLGYDVGKQGGTSIERRTSTSARRLTQAAATMSVGRRLASG